MKYRSISIALSAAVLALSAVTAFAADTKAVAPAPVPAASSTAASPSKAVVRRNQLDAKRKAAAKIKLVDINSAGAKELTKLPGIGEAEAGKIIAGRPYGSKTWLVTHKVLTPEKYQGISQLVAAKNAAFHMNKK